MYICLNMLFACVYVQKELADGQAGIHKQREKKSKKGRERRKKAKREE